MMKMIVESMMECRLAGETEVAFCLFLIGIFLNCYSGGAVQLGPLRNAATYRSIVPAPDDYDDGEIGGMMIGKGNRSTRRKPAPVPLCLPETPHACPDANPGRRDRNAFCLHSWHNAFME
jgi:hypothetical protein